MNYYLLIWNERSNKLSLNDDYNVPEGSSKILNYTMYPGESDHIIGIYLKLWKMGFTPVFFYYLISKI